MPGWFLCGEAAVLASLGQKELCCYARMSLLPHIAAKSFSPLEAVSYQEALIKCSDPTFPMYLLLISPGTTPFASTPVGRADISQMQLLPSAGCVALTLSPCCLFEGCRKIWDRPESELRVNITNPGFQCLLLISHSTLPSPVEMTGVYWRGAPLKLSKSILASYTTWTHMALIVFFSLRLAKGSENRMELILLVWQVMIKYVQMRENRGKSSSLEWWQRSHWEFLHQLFYF